MNFKRKSTKIFISFILFCFVFSLGFNFVLIPPKEAKAQASFVVGDVTSTLKMIWDKIKDFLYDAVLLAGSKAIHNAVANFFQNLAYDIASDIASAGSGQKPLVFGSNWKNYLEDAGKAAAGEAIGTLSEPFETCGISLCKPSLDTSMALRLGLFEEKFSKKEPACEWTEIAEGWESLYNEVASLGSKEGARQFLNKFQLSFQPGQNDLGFYMTSLDCITGKEQEEEKAAEKKREEGRGFSSVEDIVSGNIKTPAAMIEEEAKQMQKAGQENWKQEVASMYATSIAEPTFWATIVSTFTNTLVSKLSQRLFKGVFKLGDMLFGEPKPPGSGDDGGGRTDGGRDAAKKSFSDLISPSPTIDGDYAIETKFSICTGPMHGPDECVIDSKFTAILSQARSGDLMTVKEALDQGYLHSDYQLVGPENVNKNRDYNCYKKAYCHSNLIKLRRARVIPIGWEIAAKVSDERGQPVTLKRAMDAFNNEESPYYHLVDPDWIIKAPPAACNALVPGPTLLASGAQDRGETCVDAPTCLSDDGAGNCDPNKDGYGYCLKEKNIWRLDGAECSEEYASCLTFKRSDGQDFSYLRNTVDYRGCDANSAGCKWYSNSISDASRITSDNLVVNGSFEQDGNFDGIADGWGFLAELSDRTNAPAGTITLDSSQSFSGNNSVKIQADDITGSSLIGLIILQPRTLVYQDVSVEGDKEYTFSLYLKSQSSTTDINIGGEFKDSSGAGITSYPVTGINYTATNTDWQKYEATFRPNDIHPNTTNIRLSIFLDESNNVPIWIDDIRFGESNLSRDWSTEITDRTYFNRNIQNNTCEAEDEGCSQFLRITEGANLIYNGSFETDDNLDNVPDGWTKSLKVSDSQYTTTNGYEDIGGSAAIVSAYGESDSPAYTGSTSKFYSQTVDISPNTIYTVSGYFKDPGGNLENTTARIIVEGCFDKDGNDGGIEEIECRDGNSGCFAINDKYGSDPSGQLSDLDYRMEECHDNNDCNEFNIQYSGIGTDSFDRVFGTFHSGKSVQCTIRLAGAYTTEGFLVDGVKLEKGIRTNGGYIPTEYIEYGVLANSLAYLKKAPEYYGCQGYNKVLTQHERVDQCQSAGKCWRPDVGFSGLCVDVDSKTGSCSECGSFAAFCEAEEVGCERYAPVTGGSAVTSVIKKATSQSWNDECPAQCSGYQSFQQEPTNFESARADQKFIPFSSGQNQPQTCDEVGCDEFTNLDQAVRGGESREYYSYLRQCILPDSSCSTFYTWEGSDTIGFQLRTYSLKAEGGQPAEVVNPKDLGECNDHDDIISNPYCKEFYNQQGQISYNIYQNTVSCTEDCYRFRRTIKMDQEICEERIGGIWQEGICISDKLEQDCSDTGGQWSIEGCTYRAYPAESLSCASSNSGCRAYTGNTANNLMNVLNDDFETGQNMDWRGGMISNESTSVGGHSLMVDKLEPLTIGRFSSVERGRNVKVTRKSVSNIVNKEKTYILSFWAKGSAGEEIKARFKNTPEDEIFNNYFVDSRLNGDWQFFESKKPIRINWTTSNEELLIHTISNNFYVDNILLQEVTNSFLLIKDSWTTPGICKIGADGRSMLGCQQYTNSKSGTNYLRSFSSICRDESVGCEALIDTYNSSTRVEQIFNTENDSDPSISSPEIDNITVPADELVFMVNDPDKSCIATNKGCSAFGSPELDKSKDGEDQIKGFETVYFLNDPDKYDQNLCQVEKESCEAYTFENYDGQGSAEIYFRDPGDRVCEYREGAIIEGVQTSGWFKKDSNPPEPCPGNSSNISKYELTKNIEQDYDGWVGLCPKDENKCTEFIDPADTSQQHRSGYAYYFINDERLNRSECGGQVSEQQGCISLLNTNDFDNESHQTILNYVSHLSYAKSESKGGVLVNPYQDVASACQDLAPLDIVNALINKWSYEKVALDLYNKLFGFSSRILKSGKITAVENKCVGSGLKLDDGAINENDSECIVAIRSLCSDPNVGFKKDSNTILKVERDRVCGQWLACKGAQSVFDPVNKIWKSVCEEVAVCDTFSSKHDPFNCKNWVEDIGKKCEVDMDCNFGEYCEESTGTCRAQILDAETYQSRDTSWKGMEYSGYSIPDYNPVEYLKPVDTTGGGTGDLASSHFSETNWKLKYVDCPAGRADLGCSNIEGYCTGEDGDPCGLVINGNKGECLSGQCSYDVGDSMASVGLQCRSYPETNSPFPNTAEMIDANYQNVSKCSAFEFDENGEVVTNMINGKEIPKLDPKACECQYSYVNYGQGAVRLYKRMDADINGYSDNTLITPKYDDEVEINESNISKAEILKNPWNYKGFPRGVCSNNPVLECDPDKQFGKADDQGIQFNLWEHDCGPNDICLKPDVDHYGGIIIYKASGQLGFCLENDKATIINANDEEHACSTWLPIEVASGSIDMNNNYDSAGFDPNRDLPYNNGESYNYCFDPDVFALRYAYSDSCQNNATNAQNRVGEDICTEGYYPYYFQVPRKSPAGMNDVRIYFEGGEIKNYLSSYAVYFNEDYRIDLRVGNCSTNGSGYDVLCVPDDKSFSDRAPYYIRDINNREVLNTCNFNDSRLSGIFNSNWISNGAGVVSNSIFKYISVWSDLAKHNVATNQGMKNSLPTTGYDGDLEFINAHCVEGLRRYDQGQFNVPSNESSWRARWEEWRSWCKDYGLNYESLNSNEKLWEEKYNFPCGVGPRWENIDGLRYENGNQYEVMGICKSVADVTSAVSKGLPEKPYTNKLWVENNYTINVPNSTSSNDDFIRTKSSFIPPYGGVVEGDSSTHYPEVVSYALCRSTEIVEGRQSYNALTNPLSNVPISACPQDQIVDYNVGGYDLESLNDLRKIFSSMATRAYVHSGPGFIQKSGLTEGRWGGVWDAYYEHEALNEIFAKVYIHKSYYVNEFSDLNRYDDDFLGFETDSVVLDSGEYIYNGGWSWNEHLSERFGYGVPNISGQYFGGGIEVVDTADEGTPPQIGSVVFDGLTGKARMGDIDRFSVHESPAGDKLGQDGFYYAKVRFYAWADHDQMPLKYVRINWGDGTFSNRAIIGKYKNHKQYCSPFEGTDKDMVCQNDRNVTCVENSDCDKSINLGNCVSTDKLFGNDSDACQEGYFEFEHVYFFDNNSNSSTYEEECFYEGEEGPCSRYSIGVQVVDNWDWCNGDGGNGVYDCSFNDENAWTYYQGDIYILPEEEE